MKQEKDMEIIRALMNEGRLSFRQMAKKLKMHPATLIKRVGELEREGIIRGYSANIDLVKLGHDFIAFIEITIAKGALLEVQERIRKMDGVLGIYDVTGEYDSLVFVACKNRQELSQIVKNIHGMNNVERTNTHIVLNIIKDRYEFLPQ